MTLLQRICPHIFGWSYIPSRRRRFCRGCALQQRRPDLRQAEVAELARIREECGLLAMQRRQLELLDRWVGIDEGEIFIHVS